jgi:fructose-1,6-bisphosphatase I
MYEANPLAYVVEQAGGRAIDESRWVLDVRPASLHQKTPFFIGSEEDVKFTEEFIRGKR